MKSLLYKKGNSVVVQNAENHGVFYIVKSGTLELDSEHQLSDESLSRFNMGDSFGIVSALTGHKFLITIYAKTDVELIEIPISQIGSFLKNQKSLAIRLLSLYSKELKTIHKYLSKINPAHDRYVHPEKLLETASFFINHNNPKLASYAFNKFIEWAEDKPDYSQKKGYAQKKFKELGENYRGINWDGSLMSLETNEVLFLENEASNDIFLVKSGTVKLFTNAKNQELIIDILEKGEIFGEMAFIDHSDRMASAVTNSESEIMRFSKENLFESVGESILYKIFRSLARRIWLSHQKLNILRLKNPIQRLYAFFHSLIKDKEIKNNFQITEPYIFNFSVEVLKKMCGIDKFPNEKLELFFKDSNFIFEENSIQVKSKKRIEDKLAFFRSSSKQAISYTL